MNTQSSPIFPALTLGLQKLRFFFPPKGGIRTVSVNPLSMNSGLALLRRVGAFSMAFLPSGFDEQLVLDGITYTVDRLFYTTLEVSDYCLRMTERLLGIFHHIIHRIL